MAEPRSAAQEASDPSTSPARLLELTEKHPQLQRLILLNPSCPEVARQWILATNPWAKQAYEASLPAGPAEDPETEDPGTEDPDAVSVWGDLGTGSAAAPDTVAQERPEMPPTASVRIARDAGVVPLGASPASATSPAGPPGPDTGDDGSRTRRQVWFACGGCLLLALVLVLVVALVGRAWLAGNEDEYQRDSSTTAAEETPSGAPTEAAKEETAPADPVSPAPEDAREMTELHSPTGNISCLLEEDSVSCSVLEHDFSGTDLPDCEAGPFSIQVGEGEAARACGASSLSDSAETLEYDDSAVYGDMACTSRFDGMTCWNTITGKGFMVNRATYRTF